MTGVVRGVLTWAAAPSEEGHVAVQKAVELTGTGTSIQEAVSEALDRARLTLEDVTSFEVQRITGRVDEIETTYLVELRVWFTLLERMHG
jgi:flavin-binding protein dodecin